VFEKVPSLFKSVYTLVVLVVVVLAAFFFSGKTNQNTEETIQLKEATIKQTVKVTGPVTPTSEAALSFERAGTISAVNVSVGDKVVAGQMLASLSGQEAYASLLQAKATLANQEALLEQLEVGPRPEELAIKLQAVSNAESNLQVAYSGISDVIRDADAKVSDAIKTKLGNFFTSSGEVYTLSVSTCDQNLAGIVEAKRASFEKALASYQKETASITSLSSTGTLDKGLESAYTLTLTATALLDDLSTLISASCVSNNQSLDTQRTILSTVRSSLGLLFTDITTKRSTLASAKNTSKAAERDLELVRAGSDKTKIRAQAALVAQAKAQVAQAEAQVSKNVLTAPFNGIVTEVDITKGETASVGKTAIRVISSNAFQIEAKIPEIDIAKVSAGNPVRVTLDAYGDSTFFDAVVTRVDPSATREGNVPVYKAIISFKETDSRIKSGMTANVSIITQAKEKALVLPMRFVRVESNDIGVVHILVNKEKKSQNVTIGIRGEDGTIEILSGLMPNDTVVAIQPGERASQKEK
jgi:HlyD family secretion protein